jgi:hypothetical protein
MDGRDFIGHVESLTDPARINKILEDSIGNKDLDISTAANLIREECRDIGKNLSSVDDKMERLIGETRLDLHMSLFLLFKSLQMQLQDNPELDTSSVWHTPATAHCISTIGSNIGRVNGLGKFIDQAHSAKCTLGMNARWQEDREDYALAISEALQYWQDGGTEKHHVVARRLSKKYRLPYTPLKRKLAQIGPAGMVFGK